MFDFSIITGIEKKTPADILAPIKKMVDEALGHECEQFVIELNVEKGEMKISSEGRYEVIRNKPVISLAIMLVKKKMKEQLLKEDNTYTPSVKLQSKRNFGIVLGTIYYDKGSVSLAVKTDENEILTSEFV